MLLQQIRQRCQYIAFELAYFQISRRLVIWQPVKSLPVIRASSVRVFPAETFVNVVRRERGRSPIVSIRTRFGIHEEPVEQTESLRQRMMIGSHHLGRAVRPLRCGATSENSKLGLSIRGVPIARCLHVAKHLIVGAILLDNVDDVFDGDLSRKKFGRRKIDKPVILHGLLCVVRQRRAVRQRNHADVSGNNRPAVLPTLPVLFFIRRKRGVGWIRRATAVVHAH